MSEKTELQVRRAQARAELDHLNWRRIRVSNRCDALAKEVEDLTIELAAIEIIEDVVKARRKASYMELA